MYGKPGPVIQRAPSNKYIDEVKQREAPSCLQKQKACNFKLKKKKNAISAFTKQNRATKTQTYKMGSHRLVHQNNDTSFTRRNLQIVVCK